MAFHNRHTEEAGPPIEEIVEEAEEGKLNIFSKVHLDDMVKKLVGFAKIDQFDQPLVHKGMAKDKLELIERLMGRPASQANPMTIEIVKDMALATDYPPYVEGFLLSSEEVIAIANQVNDYVTSLKSSQGEGT